MGIDELFEFDGEIVTDEIFDSITENQYVELIENNGSSSVNAGYGWYTVYVRYEGVLNTFDIYWKPELQ